MSGPISIPAEFSPDESQAKFEGHVTLNTTTLSVFKEPKRRSDEPLFIGVCSIPLIQFYVHRRNLTLVRKSRAFLFDNAGTSAELISSSAGTNGSAGRINNPSKWDSLTVRFTSSEDCERVAQALTKRSAEETRNPPLPLGSSEVATPDSASSYHRHNEQGGRRRSSSSRAHRRVDDSRASSTASGRRHHRSKSRDEESHIVKSNTTPSRHRARRDDVVTPRGSSRAMSEDMTNSARSIDSPRSSHRPTHHRSERDREVIAPGRRPGSRHASRGVDDTGINSVASPASARSGGHRRHSSSSRRRRDDADRRESDEYFQEESPRSTISRAPARSDQEQLLRTFQKVLHHRLHFMQYLHKEMVHQAYLAEEAKVKAVSAITAAAATGGQSPRRAGGGAAQPETARLREIESRLAEVEELHREAERERDNAARLRRDYEWKLDDLNSNPPLPQQQQQQGSGAQGQRNRNRSRDPSEFNSGVPTPRRTSYSYNNGDLVPVAPRGGPQDPSMYAMVPAGGRGGDGYGNNALIVAPNNNNANMNGPAGFFEIPPEDIDLGSCIVDHYVYGNEWHRVYPSQEVDVRFNALLDICLALKVPRRLVNITGLNVDQPGLRVTAEIRFDPSKTDREIITRRMNGCPFRFLQRFYEMRDIFDPEGANGSRARGGAAGRSRPSSRTGSRRASRGPSRGAPRRHPDYEDASTDSSSDFYQDDDMYRDDDPRRAQRRAKDRAEQTQRRMQDDLRQQKRTMEEKAAADAAYARKKADYEDAKNRERQAASGAGAAHAASALAASEATERAEIEVGAARQLQTLLAAFRRQEMVLNVVGSERQRRRAIADQETMSCAQLNDMMNPGATHALLSQVIDAEGLHRSRVKQQEAKARDQLQTSRHQFLQLAYADEVDNLISDEAADRAAITSNAMLDMLDLIATMSRDKPANSTTPRGARGMSRTPYAALLTEIANQEKAEREQITKEEARRRGLYRLEETEMAEAVTREGLELAELDAREAILDSMVRAGRENLERRINDREQLQSLIAEEQFYRSAIASDEQDGFEVIAELFASALKELLAMMHEPSETVETPRHRRMSSMRVAKPFHYMTFEPEDMDYPPSAVLALEGILGCAINKNLEVVSISKPLPKVTDDELQFEAGDMILDMAGHSLHSLSHLREVLSNRAMQIQGEASEEFPDVPEDELTVNPALQKYLEVLCEHHNFLVQVLRGCDIYQIIVKS